MYGYSIYGAAKVIYTQLLKQMLQRVVVLLLLQSYAPIHKSLALTWGLII